MNTTDEKKAKRAIDTIKSSRRRPGVDIYVDLTDIHKDLIEIDIREYGKKIFCDEINIMKLSEKTHDDLFQEAVYTLFQ